MRIDALDDFAVEFEDEPEHAVRGGMLRAEIDGEVAKVVVVHDCPAFSSPGSPAPSQGERKSNWRNS